MAEELSIFNLKDAVLADIQAQRWDIMMVGHVKLEQEEVKELVEWDI